MHFKSLHFHSFIHSNVIFDLIFSDGCFTRPATHVWCKKFAGWWKSVVNEKTCWEYVYVWIGFIAEGVHFSGTRNSQQCLTLASGERIGKLLHWLTVLCTCDLTIRTSSSYKFQYLCPIKLHTKPISRCLIFWKLTELCHFVTYLWNDPRILCFWLSLFTCDVIYHSETFSRAHWQYKSTIMATNWSWFSEVFSLRWHFIKSFLFPRVVTAAQSMMIAW